MALTRRGRERQAQVETREMHTQELQDMLVEVRRQARVTRVNATTLRHLSHVNMLAHETAVLAAELLHAPLAAVNLIFADHQLTVAGVGMEEIAKPLASSYCKHVVSRQETLGIASTIDEPLVCHELATTEEGLRSYLGVPLITSDDFVIGALCVADFVPREWTASDIDALETLARRLMESEAPVVLPEEAVQRDGGDPLHGRS